MKKPLFEKGNTVIITANSVHKNINATVLESVKRPEPVADGILYEYRVRFIAKNGMTRTYWYKENCLKLASVVEKNTIVALKFEDIMG
jgi:hypothetical protein